MRDDRDIAGRAGTGLGAAAALPPRVPEAELKPEYQELKFTLHRKLLDRINLDALAGIDDERDPRRGAAGRAGDRGGRAESAYRGREAADQRRGAARGLRARARSSRCSRTPPFPTSWSTATGRSTSSGGDCLELTNVRFHDDAHLLRIIDKIVSQVGRRVDESNPMVDARLDRRIARERDHSSAGGGWPAAFDPPFRHGQADARGPGGQARRMTPGMMRLLEAAVRARLNIIVSGGTGAGKTTLLNALSAFISPKERIVTIEDAAELQLKQPHLARLETRPANLEGQGAVRQRQLLVNSLRMRPDRIIVGEVRGEEALDMLQAMNTGHDGSLTTVHANSPRDAISRLEVMVSLANANMHLTAIRQQIAAAVHILVQCSRMSDGIAAGYPRHGSDGNGDARSSRCRTSSCSRSAACSPASGRVLGRFSATGMMPKFNEKLLAAGIRLPLESVRRSRWRSERMGMTGSVLAAATGSVLAYVALVSAVWTSRRDMPSRAASWPIGASRAGGRRSALPLHDGWANRIRGRLASGAA